MKKGIIWLILNSLSIITSIITIIIVCELLIQIHKPLYNFLKEGLSVVYKIKDIDMAKIGTVLIIIVILIYARILIENVWATSKKIWIRFLKKINLIKKENIQHTLILQHSRNGEPIKIPNKKEVRYTLLSIPIENIEIN